VDAGTGRTRAVPRDGSLLDLSMLPNERRRFLATVARRSTNQGLERRGERKFPILLTFVAQQKRLVAQLEKLGLKVTVEPEKPAA